MIRAFIYDDVPRCASRSTGKERDTETGLDYFGARYYGSNMGRWMSPDWSASPEPVPYAKLDNPQTLNLYGYVQNNPATRFDLDGHQGFLDWLADKIKGKPSIPPPVQLTRTVLFNNRQPHKYGTSLAPPFMKPNPTFSTSKAAMTAAAQQDQAGAVKDRVEYGRNVIKIGKDLYTYTDPVKSNSIEGVSVDRTVPPGTDLAAQSHGHGDSRWDLDPNRASTADQQVVNVDSKVMHRDIPGAIGTPNGVIYTNPTGTLKDNQITIQPW